MAWSDDQRQEILRAYYGENLSAGQVAKRYDVSRQSIIGVVHRYSKAYGYERKGAPQSKRQTLPRKQTSPRTAQAWTPQTAPALPRLPPPAPVEHPSLALPFGELGATRCQFATTPHHVAPADHRFCGHPVEPVDQKAGGRWCAFHARLIRHPKHREDDYE